MTTGKCINLGVFFCFNDCTNNALYVYHNIVSKIKNSKTMTIDHTSLLLRSV